MLTRNILVPSKRRHDSRLICESDPVLLVGREQALQDRGSRVEHRRALSANFHADMDLLEVHELIADVADM